MNRHIEPDPTRKRRILIIDDDAGVTLLCRRILERSGDFVAMEENDALRAVEAARSFRPHLIYLDRTMPGRSGAEVARALQADPDLQTVPIVYLTGQIDKAGELEGLPALPKPIRAEALLMKSAEMVLLE